jgi:WD40 repeat protein
VTVVDVDESDRAGDRKPTRESPYDVFLSYDSVDVGIVRNVARRLREARISVWFDKESLAAGATWQTELAARLTDSRACAIFVGPRDISGWSRAEMEVAIDRANTDHDFRVFAVVLPGIDHFDSSKLPRFLAMKHWVDLRDGPESAGAVQELVNAIKGVAPQQRSPVTDDEGECPYRGLAVFEEEHADYFFGREAYVQRLLENLRRDRFAALVGQSGVGKSSLVRAGLLPRLRAGALPGSQTWQVSVLRPGPQPTASLASAVVALRPGPSMQATADLLDSDERTLHMAATMALADSAASSRLLLVVDQFEEIFTQCADPAGRTAFLQNVLYAATVPRGRTVVVVTMRADFLSHLTQFPEFAQFAQSHQMLVGRLGEQELREVIQEPAYSVGLTVEQGLAETILGDVEREPGNLPLLQMALLKTWQNRRNRMLTLDGYQATGGVQHGLGELAETVYEALSDEGRAHAMSLFLRLIQPGEGTEDTRLRIPLSEVTTGRGAAEAEVVQRFVEARLLTTSVDDATGDERIELSHEAVITGWRRCRRWVDDDRAGLLVHRRITLAAQEWKRHERNDDALFRGAQLTEAMAWRSRAPGRLNWLEEDFLAASTALRSSARRARRRRITVAFASLIVAVVAVGTSALVAMQERDVAQSRQLAAQAKVVLDVDPALSLTLALRALEEARTAEADEALRQATAQSRGRSVIPSDGGAVYSLRLLPDGARAVGGSEDGGVRVWDLAAGTVGPPIVMHRKRVLAVEVGPDRRTVASGGPDGDVRLTDLATGESRVLLSVPASVRHLAFSHRGDLLAASLTDGTVRVVEVATGQEQRVVRTAGRIAYAAAFGADDALLATSTDVGAVEVWRLSDGTRRSVMQSPGLVWGVQFSPSAPHLLASGSDGKVRIWDADSGATLQEFEVSDAGLYAVRYSADGNRIAAAGHDGRVHLLDIEGLRISTLRGHNGPVIDVGFAATGALVSAGTDGTVRTWAADDDLGARTPVTTAVFDPGGDRIMSGGLDGRLRVWRRADLALLFDVPDHRQHSHAVFSSDGSKIFSYGYNGDGVVHVRDAVDGALLARLEPGIGPIRTVDSDPADRRLVVGGETGRLAVVDHRGVGIETLTAAGSPVNTAWFSPDGRSILAGRDDGSLVLWGPDRQPVMIKPVDHRPVEEAVFGRGGSLVASADAGGGINVWDTAGRSVAVLRGHEGRASAVRFTGDGELLVTTGYDGTVRVWNVATQGLLMNFENTDGAASYVDISPDGSTIVKSAESGQALRVLSCEVCGPLDSVEKLAQPRAFRTLTPDEERRFVASY